MSESWTTIETTTNATVDDNANIVQQYTPETMNASSLLISRIIDGATSRLVFFCKELSRVHSKLKYESSQPRLPGWPGKNSPSPELQGNSASARSTCKYDGETATNRLTVIEYQSRDLVRFFSLGPWGMTFIGPTAYFCSTGFSLFLC